MKDGEEWAVLGSLLVRNAEGPPNPFNLQHRAAILQVPTKPGFSTSLLSISRRLAFIIDWGDPVLIPPLQGMTTCRWMVGITPSPLSTPCTAPPWSCLGGTVSGRSGVGQWLA